MAGKVTMLKPGDIELDRPLDEMSEQEKADVRAEVVAKLALQASQGNKLICDIAVDSGEYKGTIQMKRPSLDEERQIGIRIAKYLQGAVGADVKTENICIYFAYFDICVVWETAPSWFKPREMHDYNLINYIFGRFAEWRRTFREFVPPESQGDSEITTI